MRALRPGEYDLVNINLIGYDPVTGRSYEECQDEWDAALKKLAERQSKCRRWNFVERFRVARQVAIMEQRMGMYG